MKTEPLSLQVFTKNSTFSVFLLCKPSCYSRYKGFCVIYVIFHQQTGKLSFFVIGLKQAPVPEDHRFFLKSEERKGVFAG